MAKTRIESIEAIVTDPDTGEPIINPATGLPRKERRTIEYQVDNAWILARQSSTVLLSADSLAVAVNGSIQLSAQLRTPELADYSYENLSDNLAIQLQLGDSLQTINLVNGFFSDTLPFVLAGTYRLECLDLPSNVLVVEVS